MDATVTKNKIIDGAKQIFFTRGFDAATLVEIAEVCGVNQALINYHFRTKRTLYRFIVLQVLENEIYPEFQNLIKEDDPVKRMDQMTDLSHKIIHKYPRFLLIMLSQRDPIYNDILLWIDHKNKSLEKSGTNYPGLVNTESDKVQDLLVMFVLSIIPVALRQYYAPVLTKKSEHILEIFIENIIALLSNFNE